MKQIVLMLALLVPGCAKTDTATFVDVDKVGNLSLNERMITLSGLSAALDEKSHSNNAAPVVIRSAPHVEHKRIRAILQTCNRNGYTNLILADAESSQDSLRPWLATDPAKMRRQFQLNQPHEPFSTFEQITNSIPASSLAVFVFADAFVANGKRMSRETLVTELTTFKNTTSGDNRKVFIMCTWDSTNGTLVWLLNVCAEKELKQIFLTSI